MTKLKSFFVAAFVAVPLFAFASQSIDTDAARAVELKPTTNLTSCCPVFFAGRWWCMTC